MKEKKIRSLINLNIYIIFNMSMFNMFSSCFIWLLCILLIAVSFIYLSQKISEQNHKISSMIGLISSMAEELQHSKKDTRQIHHPIIELSELINVSEDEADEDEEDEDEDEDDEDDEDEDEEDVDEDDVDEEDDEKNTDEDTDVDSKNIHIINIGEDLEINISDIDIDVDIKSIHINPGLEIEKINYKKLKIDQLKSMVTQKGLGDALQISKFKKDELIKLLSE